jgi:hypothetical protein
MFPKRKASNFFADGNKGALIFNSPVYDIIFIFSANIILTGFLIRGIPALFQGSFYTFPFLCFIIPAINYYIIKTKKYNPIEIYFKHICEIITITLFVNMTSEITNLSPDHTIALWLILMSVGLMLNLVQSAGRAPPVSCKTRIS